MSHTGGWYQEEVCKVRRVANSELISKKNSSFSSLSVFLKALGTVFFRDLHKSHMRLALFLFDEF